MPAKAIGQPPAHGEFEHHRLVPGGLRRVLRQGAGQAGVIDQNIDAAEIGQHGRGQCRRAVVVGQVGRHPGGLEGAQIVGAPCADRQLRALGRQHPGDANADAGAGPGDQGDFVVKLKVHRPALGYLCLAFMCGRVARAVRSGHFADRRHVFGEVIAHVEMCPQPPDRELGSRGTCRPPMTDLVPNANRGRRAAQGGDSRPVTRRLAPAGDGNCRRGWN